MVMAAGILGACTAPRPAHRTAAPCRAPTRADTPAPGARSDDPWQAFDGATSCPCPGRGAARCWDQPCPPPGERRAPAVAPPEPASPCGQSPLEGVHVVQ